MATFKGSRHQYVQHLNRFVAALAGRVSDPELGPLIGPVKMRAANALLSQILLAFEEKAHGETGSDGIKWPPLKRSTVAERRLGPGDKKALQIGGRRVRGLLTPAEDKEWRKIFGSRFARLRLTMPEGAAKAKAAAIAWAVMKAKGAKTKLEVLGGRKVDILMDTGELFRSFTPGVEDRASGVDGQVVEFGPGSITVGTNKKVWHHRGIPGKLPARPFWPLDGSMPPAWARAVTLAASRGISQAILLLDRG